MNESFICDVQISYKKKTKWLATHSYAKWVMAWFAIWLMHVCHDSQYNMTHLYVTQFQHDSFIRDSCGSTLGVGMFSIGIFSFGAFSIGIFSVGFFSIGFVSLGTHSLSIFCIDVGGFFYLAPFPLEFLQLGFCLWASYLSVLTISQSFVEM